MTTTLDDLLHPRDRNTIETILMSVLQAATIDGQPGTTFPVTDWHPGSFERTHMKMIATGLLDREEVLKFIAGGGFLSIAPTLTDANGDLVEGWMEMLAESSFGLTRAPATFSQQRLTLTCTSGPGPYTRGAGEMIARAPSSGNRYVNIDEITIPDGGSVTAAFQAESPGLGYSDAIGSIIELVTPLPGVSVTNAPTAAGIPASYITGTGSIAVSSTAITTSPRTLKLTFTSSGRADDSSAIFTATVYSGITITTYPNITATATYTQGDLELTLTDGAADTTSFVAGDEWIVGVPGTPLLQAGADEESLSQLAQRCLDRWPSLGDIPTAGRFVGWVRECSTLQSLGITKIRTAPSELIAGQEDVYIAGSTATATVEQVAAIQEYLDVRVSDVEQAMVYAAQAYPVELSGTVTCKRGRTTAAKAAADAAWLEYIADLDIGGDLPGGIVRLDKLAEILMDAGAYTYDAIALNGFEVDLAVPEYACVSLADAPDGAPSTALTWLEVA